MVIGLLLGEHHRLARPSLATTCERAHFGRSANPARSRPRSALGPVQVQGFHLFSRPGRAPQKFEAGFETGVELKTTNINQLTELNPAVTFQQRLEDRLESDPMQRIASAGVFSHDFAPGRS